MTVKIIGKFINKTYFFKVKLIKSKSQFLKVKNFWKNFHGQLSARISYFDGGSMGEGVCTYGYGGISPHQYKKINF